MFKNRKQQQKHVVSDLWELFPVSDPLIFFQTMVVGFGSIHTWRGEKNAVKPLKMYVKFYFSNEWALQWYAHRAEFTLHKLVWNYIIQRPWYSEGWLDLIITLTTCSLLAQNERNCITETIVGRLVSQDIYESLNTVEEHHIARTAKEIVLPG